MRPRPVPALYRLTALHPAEHGCVTIEVVPAHEVAAPRTATLCDGFSVQALAAARPGWMVAIANDGERPRLAPVTVALSPAIGQPQADGDIPVGAEPRPSPVLIAADQPRLLAEVRAAERNGGAIAFALAGTIRVADAKVIDRELALAMLGMRERR